MNRLLASAVLFALSAPAFAATATITRMSGDVLVNQGESFQPARTGQVLSTGDRVMVPANGSTSLSFDDGCAIDLPPDTLVTIPSSSTCAGGNLASQSVTPGNGGAVGSRVGTAAGDSAFGWGAMGAIALITAFKVAEADNDTESP